MRPEEVIQTDGILSIGIRGDEECCAERADATQSWLAKRDGLGYEHRSVSFAQTLLSRYADGVGTDVCDLRDYDVIGISLYIPSSCAG